MTDAAYCFRETERESKRTARGVFGKKSGRRSKKCTLMQDKMTKKEWKEMNSRVYTLSLGKPMNKSEFKALSDDLKREYITSLAEKHEARRIDIANMLGYSQNGFWTITSKLFGGSGYPFQNRKKVSPKWEEFIKGNSPELTPVTEPDTVETIVESKPIAPAPSFDMNELSVKATGDPWLVFSKIVAMLDPDISYNISVEVSPLELPF